MNPKIVLFAIALPAMNFAVQARTLTPSEALSRAMNTEVRQIPAESPSSYTLAHTLNTSKGQAAIYLFNGNSGFIAVSADDDAAPLLGYGTGEYNPAEVPPALTWWLGEYAREIEAADVTYTNVTRAAKAPIEPLVKTSWNQDAPYNNLCPVINGERAVTGCVATALAQIMKYHQWPAKGTGSHTYSSNGTTVSMDFGNTTFDWSNMLDSYTGVSNTTAETAVATLMKACGVSVDMQYTASESSAMAVAVPAAMVTYFGYDAALHYVERDYYGLTQWEDYVYNQLSNYGPVQYSGQSNQGGHSFVCDGYSSDGYFHINWGWGGMSDGYFLLTALNPLEQGIGGSTSGFNYDQSIIADVCKPKVGSSMYINLLMDGDFTISPTSTSTGGSVSIQSGVYNYSTGSVSGMLGLQFTPVSGGTPVYGTGTTVNGLPYGYGYNSYSATVPSSLPDGQYVVTPAFQNSDGQWSAIPVKVSAVQKYIVTVQNGMCTFTPVEPAQLNISNLTAETDIYFGQDFKLSAYLTVSGSGEYLGVIAPALFSGSSIVALADNYSVDLEGGQSATMEYVGKFTKFTSTATPPAGRYTLYMVDANTYEPVSSGITVNVKSATSTTISCTAFSFAGNADSAIADNLNFSATIECSEGYFGGTLTLAIFPYSTSSVSSVGSFSTPEIFLSAGNSQTLDISGALSDAETGKTYMAALFNGSTQLNPVVKFTITALTGVATLDTDTEFEAWPNPTTGTVFFNSTVHNVNIYDAEGRLAGTASDTNSADLSNQKTGLYIMEIQQGATPEKTIIRRVIRR
ncbi:MAG: thiol protease/hemagglutinin PrtT [Muribaculaceae bacterium]|nr:thiol protease/hemagglutinin PrtT [Muribaculaceae bacterium]